MATNLTGLTDKALVSRAPTVYKRREGWSDVAVEALDELRQRHGEDKMTWKQFRDEFFPDFPDNILDQKHRYFQKKMREAAGTEKATKKQGGKKKNTMKGKLGRLFSKKRTRGSNPNSSTSLPLTKAPRSNGKTDDDEPGLGDRFRKLQEDTVQLAHEALQECQSQRARADLLTNELREGRLRIDSLDKLRGRLPEIKSAVEKCKGAGSSSDDEIRQGPVWNPDKSVLDLLGAVDEFCGRFEEVWGDGNVEASSTTDKYIASASISNPVLAPVAGNDGKLETPDAIGATEEAPRFKLAPTCTPA